MIRLLFKNERGVAKLENQLVNSYFFNRCSFCSFAFRLLYFGFYRTDIRRKICQVFLAKKWGILIKKESESLGLTVIRN